MKTEPGDLKVRELLTLKSQQMLVVNSEYQRGDIWKPTQQKKLVDSVLRGYPIPLIYFHHIQQVAAGLRSERLEVIDGQQRINALHAFHAIRQERRAEGTVGERPREPGSGRRRK